MATLQLTISDMACGACVATITKAVQDLDAAATLDADTQTKQVTITTTAAPDLVKGAIATAGYTITAQ
ncbi:MAG: heavy-metal-associated domain-containing protein [Leptolyngbyaceae bacterium]|nr:heavy-metal-associated domain-containing protein [Leptolyngbyaceae bacterium]